MKQHLIRFAGSVLIIQSFLAVGCDKTTSPENTIQPTDSPASATGKLPYHSSLPRPNIILIYTDDIDCESVFSTWPEQNSETIRFPNLKRLAERGTTFTNFHVTTPVCGPSRASLLSGQYAHRNGIRVNSPNVSSANGFDGGYQRFNKKNELGLWMKQAGYSTAYVGKYLHSGFAPRIDGSGSWEEIMPAGWDEFCANLGSNYLDFGHYRKGQGTFQKITDQYRTDQEAELVTEIIDSYGAKTDAKSDQPFFLCWAPITSHVSVEYQQMAAKRHQALFENELPSGAVQDGQADPYVTMDKPAEVALIPPYKGIALNNWCKVHQHRLRSIQALDEAVGEMLSSLENTNQLDNTLILFTSDHGFSLGQHGHFGKRFPYDRITKVPFIVCGPGVPENQKSNQLLANIDIAPTLVDLASGKVPESVDGISFASLLKDPTKELARDGILIENWDRIWANGVHIEAAYVSLRTHDRIYTEWASGSYEYFDLRTDPNQLNNLYSQLESEVKQELRTELAAVRSRSDASPVFGTEFKFPVANEEKKVFSANFIPATFSGFVDAANGLDSVDLEIYCDKIKSWWDGDRWSTSPTTVAAKLATPGGHVSRWSYTLDTSPIAFDENTRMSRRDTVINLIATDSKDRKTRWESAFEFKMKIGDPETWIDAPQHWDDRSKPFKISGRAADNFKIDNVEMLVVDLDRNLFWDDAKQEWVEKRTVFKIDCEPLERDESGDWLSWSYEFDGPQEGKLFFCPRAFDAEGNFDMSLGFHIIPLENPKSEPAKK